MIRVKDYTKDGVTITMTPDDYTLIRVVLEEVKLNSPDPNRRNEIADLMSRVCYGGSVDNTGPSKSSVSH